MNKYTRVMPYLICVVAVMLAYVNGVQDGKEAVNAVSA